MDAATIVPVEEMVTAGCVADAAADQSRSSAADSVPVFRDVVGGSSNMTMVMFCTPEPLRREAQATATESPALAWTTSRRPIDR